jgi:hypothetical protein
MGRSPAALEGAGMPVVAGYPTNRVLRERASLLTVARPILTG